MPLLSPRPRHPMEHRGEVLSAWFPTLRSRRARTAPLNATRSGAPTTVQMVRGGGTALVGRRTHRHPIRMFIVTEADAATIRAVFNQEGELSAAI